LQQLKCEHKLKFVSLGVDVEFAHLFFLIFSKAI